MADQSTQHGQRVDDEMEHEVEALVRGAPVNARAREDLEFEPFEPTTVPLGDPDDDEQHLEVIERSELARFLRPSALPADAATVLAVAREEQAPDAVLAELAALPPGVRFATVAEIWEALGHETEHRDHAHDEPEPEPEPGADAGDEAQAGRERRPATAAAIDAEGEGESAVDDVAFEPPAVLPAPPSGESPPPTPTPVVAPVPEPASPGPLRGAIVLGIEMTRAGLGIADRVLEGVERLISR
jgi:hypothetical protein